MNILLLGATGQLGYDIQRLASEETRRINITPWSRATLDVARIDAIPLQLEVGSRTHVLLNGLLDIGVSTLLLTPMRRRT